MTKPVAMSCSLKQSNSNDTEVGSQQPPQLPLYALRNPVLSLQQCNNDANTYPCNQQQSRNDSVVDLVLPSDTSRRMPIATLIRLVDWSAVFAV